MSVLHRKCGYTEKATIVLDLDGNYVICVIETRSITQCYSVLLEAVSVFLPTRDTSALQTRDPMKPEHGVEVKRGPSGHFFVQKSCDGEVFPGPFRRIPLGETTSTALPRRAPRLTWASRRVPHKPPHCMHSRPGTPPPDPADRILAPWQSRVPCIPLRIFPAPPHAPGHCRG